MVIGIVEMENSRFLFCRVTSSYRLIKLAYDLLSEKLSSFVFIVLVELENKIFKLTRDNIWQMMKDYWTLQLGAPYCYAT